MRNNIVIVLVSGLIAVATAQNEVQVVRRKHGKKDENGKKTKVLTKVLMEYTDRDGLEKITTCMEKLEASGNSVGTSNCQEGNGKTDLKSTGTGRKFKKICIEYAKGKWASASDLYFNSDLTTGDGCFEPIPPRELEKLCEDTATATIKKSVESIDLAIQCAVHNATGGSIRQRDFYESQQHLADRIDKYITKSAGTDENFVMSPVSIHMLTEMIFMGVDFSSNSAKQLWKVLGYPTTGETKTLEDTVEAVKEAKNLKTYIFSKVKLNDQYETDVSKKFNASIDDELSTLSGMEKKLNDLIETNTGGEIKEFFKKGAFTSDTMAVLLNTILFQEAWKQKFDGKTRKDKWDGTKPGKKRYNVDYMTTKAIGKYKMYKKWDGDLSTTFLRLNFGNNQTMTIVMPVEFTDTGVKKVQDFKVKAHEYTFEDVKKVQKKMRPTKTYLRLPKFEFASEIDLKEAFQSMGVTDLFQSGNAKLNAMFAHDNNFHVSQFKHKATIKVDEEGAKASAVTAATVVNKSLPSTLRISRDFRFFIHDKDYKNILFSGVVRTPTEVKKGGKKNRS